MNPLLWWLLRLYPRTFRAQFETEMIQTLAEAMGQTLRYQRGAVHAFYAREATGIVRGVAREWLAVGAWHIIRFAKERGHWATAFAIAIAVQCSVYGVLVPIGPRGISSTGAGLYRLGAMFVCVAVAIEVSRAIVAAGTKQRRIQ